MAQPKTQTLAQQELLVLESAPAGIDKIPAGTPLTRLNYYDGLFLRASHMDAEQRYVRALAGFANQGLGPGLVHGFSTELQGTGDMLAVRAGLAFDAQGRTLFLPRDVKVGVQELIDKSRAATSGGAAPGGLLVGGEFGDCTVMAEGPTSAPVPEGSVYVISICHLEALCGQDDVYGRLCEKACATDVERPWRVEGVVLRALPLPLTTPFPQSLSVSLSDERFLRSNVAHSFFEDERLRHPHLISAAGLRSHAWCLGAGVDRRGCEVPLAVIARAGGKTLFLDPWIVRRERMETPSRRYWDWRMAMRPWDVFLAQVLQFQCQLADGAADVPPDVDPCEVERQALDAGVQTLDATLKQIQDTSPDQPPPFVQGLTELRAKFAELLLAPPTPAPGGAHILIDRGFGELPPAGWLPVVAGKVVQSQVRALMGAGLDLRFCIVRPDYIGHALEEAQHLERISLTKGLDDPKQLEEVDILVPNGVFVDQPQPQPQTGTLRGRVMDPNGGAIPGVVVSAMLITTGASAQTITDAKAEFTFTGLAPGTYQVSVQTAAGNVTRPATVVAGQVTNLDLIVGGPGIIVDPVPGAGGLVSGTSLTSSATGLSGLRPARPILATLDWVFFHRRREKQCGGEPPAPPVKTRTYQIFHLADDFRVDDIKAAFADPQSAQAFAKRLRAVGPAEFGAGTAELVTPAASLLAAWQAVQPRNRVFSAVVATPGSDDDNVERARLDSVFKVIEPVSSSAGADTGRMDDVPAVLGLAAGDGFMLIDTLGQTVPLQSHEVFLVSPDTLKRLQVTVPQGVLDPQLLANAESLLRADFSAGSDTLVAPPDLAAYVAAWNTATGGAGVLGAINVSRKAVPAAEQQAHVKQGLLLSAKLDASVTGVLHGAVDDLGPRVAPEIPTITLVAPKAQQLTARIVVYSRNDVPQGEPGRRRQAVIGGAAPDLLMRFARQGGVWTATLDNATRQTLLGMRVQGLLYDLAQLVHRGAPDPEASLRVRAAAEVLTSAKILFPGSPTGAVAPSPREDAIFNEGGVAVDELLRLFDPIVIG